MLRIIFRAVLVVTLAALAILKASGTSVPATYVQAISYWLLFTALVAVVFLILACIQAVRDSPNRRLHIRDAMLAVVWLIFWILSLGR